MTSLVAFDEARDQLFATQPEDEHMVRRFAELATGIVMPDVDLLVRTAGELRVSNYLLWQISYAELWVTETLWPDFGREELFDALRAFAARERRYGALEPGNG